MQRALPLSRCPRRLLVHSGLPFTGLLQNLLDIYTGRHRVDPAPKHYTARPTKGKKDLCCGSPHHDTAKLSLKASCGFALELVWFRLRFWGGSFTVSWVLITVFRVLFTLFSRCSHAVLTPSGFHELQQTPQKCFCDCVETQCLDLGTSGYLLPATTFLATWLTYMRTAP